MYIYAIALGSNRRHGRYGAPYRIIEAATTAFADLGRVVARSRVIATPALGPAGRAFANAALLLETEMDPPKLLRHLQCLERGFGRRRGRRWGARVLDLDILLWSGGRWHGRRPGLAIPHPRLTERRFVLDPMLGIAPGWRLPGACLRIRHAHARLTRRPPLHRDAIGSGL